MGEILELLNGVNGQFDLYEDRVVIHRNGLSAKLHGFFQGKKEIPMDQICGVKVRLGNPFLHGQLRLVLIGEEEDTSRAARAARRANSVMFASKDNRTVKEIRAKIEALVAQRGNA